MKPSDILRAYPGPWQQVTYTDASIRVFCANGTEVGLLDILAFSLGVVNAAAAHTASQTNATETAQPPYNK